MDVTPQLLQDIEFREKVRGYHPDDVDDFLERVGVAFSELVDRLRQANDRADAAERQLAERADVDESTLSRTLVLAQRTADAAVAEAKAEAELTLSEAKAEAERTVAEATAEAEQARAEAKREAEELVAGAREEREDLLRNVEADAQRKASEATAHIEAEVARLESRRDEIVAQSGGLEDWLASQRVKLESVAADLQEILDDPDRLRADPAPRAAAPTPADVGDDAETFSSTRGESETEGPGIDLGVADQSPSHDGAVSHVHDPAGDGDATTTPEAEDGSTDPHEGVGDRADVSDADAPLGLDTPLTSTEESDEGDDQDSLVLDLAEAEDFDDRPSRVSVVRASVERQGERAAAAPTDEPTGTSDSFLEELRRAVEAPTDLVESDEDRALSAFFEHEDEEPKRRFGRRR